MHVVYGMVGLKTHCKAALVVRREHDGIRRYVHLGTGNYNPTTARLYTDLSFFTCRPEFGEDASALFNLLTGYSQGNDWNRLIVAPKHLANRLIGLIERERAHAEEGRPARIIAKINSLVDPTVIEALYRASQAGVRIDLIVRGICCLRPGMPGVSDNIRVISIVDKFLEHSRIAYFQNGDEPEVFLASADWMPRNFRRRVEIMFPIESPRAAAPAGRRHPRRRPGRQRQGPRAPARRHLPPHPAARPGEPLIRSQVEFQNMAIEACETSPISHPAHALERRPQGPESGPQVGFRDGGRLRRGRAWCRGGRTGGRRPRGRVRCAGDPAGEEPPGRGQDPDLRGHAVQHHQCPGPAAAGRGAPARSTRRIDVGRCRGIRAIQQAFGAGGAFLGPSLRRLDVDATIRLFEQAGVATKVEGNGKVFPASDRAVDVLDALVAAAGAFRRLAAMPLSRDGDRADRGRARRFAGIRRPPAGFDDRGAPGDRHGRRPLLSRLRHHGRRLRDRRLAGPLDRRAAAGARADPGRMRTGSPTSAASPCPTSWPRSTPRAVGSLQDRREAVLFAHFGLTGPAILDVSRAVARSDDPRRLGLRLDLIPDVPREKLNGRSKTIEPARPPAADVPPARRSLPRRLAECIVDGRRIPRDRMGPDLSRDERHRLVDALKGLSLPILGTLGFEKAEVTSGGVALDQVDPRTLESRLVPGLHFAGEVLDLDGLIGGYNFQAAWSTGWLAGEAAASSAKS